MPALFGLLTGIKDYHPDALVSSLTGCLNDVNALEACLQKRFAAADLHIVKLLNEQATRKNFTETFISHLINNTAIQKDDIVLFYYSGHGSYEKSNPAFAASDSQQQDETMVLYDSRCPGNFDLADKELGLLIAHIPAHANIVVIMDSCHAGSATRSVDHLDAILMGKPKHAPTKDNDSGRQLADYITVNGMGYEQMLNTAGQTSVPAARYIALAACDRYEVAYESPAAPAGMFTNMLLQALEAGPVNINYAQLFEYLHTLLKRRIRQQTPQLEIYEGYNPATVVFGNTLSNGKYTYRVAREADGSTTIDCGALHGLKNDPASIKKIAVIINDNGEAKPAIITAVGLDKSTLAGPKLTPKIYDAEIVNLPPAIIFLVKAHAAQQQAWAALATIGKKENIGFVYTEDQGFDYLLSFTEKDISITEKESGRLVHGAIGTGEDCIKYMVHCCNQMGAWQQLLALNNNAMTEKIYNNSFKATFGIELLDADLDFQLQEGKTELVLYSDTGNTKIPFRIYLKTASSQSLYCAIYTMNSRFEIKKRTRRINESQITAGTTLSLSEKTFNFNIPDGEEEVTDYFKLIISKKPFKDYLISEFDSLPKELVMPEDRGFVFKNIDEDSIDQDWYAQTISVTLRRNAGKISAAKAFNTGKLTIYPHNRIIGATASLSAIPAGAKSVHASQQLQQLMQANGHTIVSINNSKSAGAADAVVWIDNLPAQALQETMKISLAEAAAEDQELMAVTMQDGIVQVLATGLRNESGGYDLEIVALPEEVNRKKSLLGSAWFCFVKVVLKKDPSKLREVTYENGKARYGEKAVANIIRPGKRTAVLVHGIIGDSGGIAPAMEFLLTGNYYDCILAFDYENLNTKIEDIANTFKTLLLKAGAAPDAPVDIICHSMGGLVSRYMIEQIPSTDTLVNRLYMFGTPNAGSAFGKLPAMRDWAVAILTLACNCGGSWLGALGPVLHGVNKVLGTTKILTTTLAQMADDSDFYKRLNNAPAHVVQTRYHLIAGNVLAFAPADDDGRFSKMMEKIKKQIGVWAYSSTKKNDIAVGVDSIMVSPAANIATQVEMACHHLNYFELDSTMNYFKKLVALNHGV